MVMIIHLKKIRFTLYYTLTLNTFTHVQKCLCAYSTCSLSIKLI